MPKKATTRTAKKRSSTATRRSSKKAGPDAALQRARVLAWAMLGGVVMVAAGVYLLRSVNFGQLDAGHPLLERVWQMATIAALVGWFVLTRKVKAGEADSPDRAVTMLATAWGALEGACLFGVAAAILSGAGYALVVAVGVMAAGVALSWPKPEWFGATGGSAA